MIHLTDRQVAHFLWWLDVIAGFNRGFDLLYAPMPANTSTSPRLSRGINEMLGEES